MAEKLYKEYLNSANWEKYRGAGGNVAELVARFVAAEAEEKEEAWEGLCENLSHQVSIYGATYLVLPYVVDVLKEMQKEQDLQWQQEIIRGIGIVLSTYTSKEFDKEVTEPEILKSFHESCAQLEELTKAFIRENIEELQELDEEEKSQIAIAVLAILGDKRAANALINLAFDECYVVCSECEYCDEDMAGLSEEEPENITPAESVIGKWDGVSYEDTYLWFSNFLMQLGEEEYAEKLRYYYGTYTCPECETEGKVMDLIFNYFEL